MTDAEMKKQPSAIQKLNAVSQAGGAIINSGITFLNTTLGNIGKLLSTAVIIFAMYLIWTSFFGQVTNIPDVPLNANEVEKKAVLSERRAAYRDAIGSISAPLATLGTVIPAIIGIGLMVKRRFGGDAAAVNGESLIAPAPTQPLNENTNVRVSYND